MSETNVKPKAHTTSIPHWVSTSTTSSSVNRSPFLLQFNEMFNTWLPSGHEKALKLAFYNTIALIFLGFVVCILVAVYFIFESFIRALVWAVLCGSALHPFKRKAIYYTRNWIKDLRSSGTPITIATVCLPITITNHLLDTFIEVISKYYKLLIAISIPLPVLYLYIHYLSFIHEYCYSIIFISGSFIAHVLTYLMSVQNTYIIMSIFVIYISSISFCWSDKTETFFIILSPFIWMTLVINFLSMMGTYGYLITIFLVFVVIVGILKTIVGAQSRTDTSTDQIDSVSAITVRLIHFIYFVGPYINKLFARNGHSTGDDHRNENTCDKSVAGDDDSQQITEKVSVATSPLQLIETNSPLIVDKIDSASNKTRFSLSNAYLYALLWVFIVVHIWCHMKLLYLLAIPIFLILIRFGWHAIVSMLFNNINVINNFVQTRDKALIHPFIKSAYYYFLVGDNMITDIIELSLNAITSMSVICIMVISILFATVFMAIQIYGESIHLVNVMGNVVNKTIGDNPELSHLLPESFQGVHGVLDEVIRNAYQYGRQYIKDTIRNALNVDGNYTKTKLVEKQILEIWDRAYHLWLVRNSNETELLPKRGPYDFDKLINALKTLDFSLGFNILKENFDTVISVFDSVWLVLKGNVALIFSAIAAVFSSLLGGGTALLNFFLNFIVFTTALFYLLSASGEQYKPIELVNSLFPSESHQQKSASHGSKFGRAVEEAIRGVFAASLKISMFYGIYTWLIHTLFEVNIVYIPTVLAAIFGAVPILGAYWASFPAIIELWLVHRQTSKAIFMAISAILPVFFIDSSIYSEIKSAGHPYLTGLAIAGGIFYLGFEGALFGPILLCCLFVAFNIYSSIIQESATTTPISRHESTTPSTNKLKRLYSTND